MTVKLNVLSVTSLVALFLTRQQNVLVVSCLTSNGTPLKKYNSLGCPCMLPVSYMTNPGGNAPATIVKASVLAPSGSSGFIAFISS